ncbi:Sorting nexin-1 [Larimichthys crocea]|uniref:Uncharacterized protein n=1 Tax=Larimichthys crocea TaxID=215358 RepID=A0ACD3QEZ1_LARCR|nr:Sorting nexin-1 [Larimichthys crocea]
MATSSERSPPPFPDSEDQDVLDAEDVGGRDSDEEDEGEDIFMGASNPPLIEMDPTLPPASQPSDVLMKPPADIMSDPLFEPVSSQAENKPTSEEVSEPSDDFVDLTNNLTDSPDDSAAAASAVADAAKDTTEILLDEPTEDFVDIFGSETEAPGEEVLLADVTVEAATDKSEVTNNATDPTCAAPPAAEAKKPSRATVDLFEDDGSDLFMEPRQAKSSKQPQKSLFGEADEDLFSEPLGATSKKTVSKEQKDKPVMTKAAGDASNIGGPLQDSNPVEPGDLFTEEAIDTVPSIRNTSTVNSKTNGVHSEEETDIFAEATVELSLDSPRDERKKDAAAKPSVSTASSSLSAAASPDKATVCCPGGGDGMNAYMAYKVSTQTSLSMFRNKTFTVRRRFSDFLGLYEKLSEKHGPNGFIVPPPPEKSILGMTKVKVGKEDSSSADFVERRRGALERYLQRVVNHPSLLQDPDVREFLEREELPRAVSTQALSGAGFLKMINKATDAVSKMTIKMNESDVWFEEKLQEVESADQQFRKLHALVENLVIHRKELSLNTASFAKSTAMLGSAEDNTALSRALSQLAEVEDKMEQLHQDQAANDTFSFAEVIADYIRLLGAVRRWQDAQAVLQKKRETEAKLLWANKPDKLQLAKEEIAEWEAKVTQYERDFERVSATVRKEVVRFEKEKAKNFKRQVIKYLEALLQSQQQLIKYWEAFLPEAKAIA